MQALRGRFLQRLVMLEMQQGLGLFYDSFRKFAHRLLLPWDSAGQSCRRPLKKRPPIRQGQVDAR